MKRPATENQLSESLPGPRTIITGHDSTGSAIIHEVRSVKWTSFQEDRLGLSVAYTTQFPVQLSDDADIHAHDALVDSGRLGLVNPNGTVLRYVDIAPGHECIMHRTQSVDYGIVLEGEVVAVMGSGEEIIMGRGDTMIQRATMHQWRNDSKTQWVRMIFCLQGCQDVMIKGKKLGEDLGVGMKGLLSSEKIENKD
ncbi:hypothetical protein Cpir12675_006405 [Ceratocystis pirilliformis]|uniref:Cupin type-2 domain-containing protein n=1 Tax=Ceratocystis pirilliformis TaxID=259994 RepID=A0ABR3YI51_9PEZI